MVEINLIFLLLNGIFWGVISSGVGKSKGINGFGYGFWLGFIGFIIVLCMNNKADLKEHNGLIETNASNKYDKLEKLYDLKKDGVLTQEEFDIEKDKILN